MEQNFEVVNDDQRFNIIMLMDYLKSHVEGFDPEKHNACLYSSCRCDQKINKWGRYTVTVYPTYILVFNENKCFGGVSMEKLIEDGVKLKIYPHKRFLTSFEGGRTVTANLNFPVKILIMSGLKEYNGNKYYSYNIRNLSKEESQYYKDYKLKHKKEPEPKMIDNLEMVDPNAFV